jgi:hypothetical protein
LSPTFLTTVFQRLNQSIWLIGKKMAENEGIILIDFSKNSLFKVQNAAISLEQRCLCPASSGNYYTKIRCWWIVLNFFFWRYAAWCSRWCCICVPCLLPVYFPIICNCTNTMIFFEIQKMTMNYIKAYVPKVWLIL